MTSTAGTDQTNGDVQTHKAASQDYIAHAPSNFVLGSRTKPSERRDESFRPTTNLQRPTEADQEIEFLKHLSDDFAQLLNRTDISDCLLNVGGTYMAVHRCVLAARSSVFAAAISGNINRDNPPARDQLTAVSKDQKIVINIDRTDAETMKHVVIFLYTGRCELNESNAYRLLDAAGRYDIKSLKVHTGRYVSAHINPGNFLRVISAAYKYENALVRQKCIEFFINNGKTIMDGSDHWKDFAQRNEAIVAELLYWTVHKEEFYQNNPPPSSYSQW